MSCAVILSELAVAISSSTVASLPTSIELGSADDDDDDADAAAAAAGAGGPGGGGDVWWGPPLGLMWAGRLPGRAPIGALASMAAMPALAAAFFDATDRGSVSFHDAFVSLGGGGGGMFGASSSLSTHRVPAPVAWVLQSAPAALPPSLVSGGGGGVIPGGGPSKSFCVELELADGGTAVIGGGSLLTSSGGGGGGSLGAPS